MTKPIVVLVGPPDWTAALTTDLSESFEPTVYTESSRYVSRLADDGAAAVIINADAEPNWSFWTTTPKSSPATRRIPIIVIASDPARHDAARSAGADQTLTPAEMPTELRPLLIEVARVVSTDEVTEMTRQCTDALPAEALEAIRLFNAGEFYKQHDAFEALWMAEPGPVRNLYRAILQVGVSYYQIERGNPRGALKMLLRSVQWLALLPDECQGVDVARLKADAAAVRAELERVGEDGIDQFDTSLLKPVQLVNREV